jgi:dihydrofolate reductase
MKNRKLVLFISMSLDGFIATKNHDLSWLSVVERKGEDYGYQEFNKSVDTYIVGRKTYDTVLNLTNGTFPPAEKHQCFVVTRKKRENKNGVTFYTGDIEMLISGLKNEKGKNIYCDGGGQLVKFLMEKNLIDEYRISVIPLILGSGIRLFKGETPRIHLKALPCKQYASGLVQLHYVKR